MGWRFRKSVKILPGVRVNFGKKGLTSLTVGGKYAKTNISKRGTYNTYSVPGTGVSYRTKVSGGSSTNQNYSSNQSPLYWYCKNCYIANSPDVSVCRKCAGEFNANPQQPTQLGANDGKVLGIIICSIVGLIFLSAIISSVIQKPNRSNVSTTQFNQPSSTDSKPLSSTNNELPLKVPAKSTTDTKATKTKSKTAVIISENANLRQTPTADGQVIQTLPAGENIEVVKQKGAWFYIRANGNSGWMHGNTIKYAEGNNSTISSPDPSLTESYSPAPSQSYSSGSSYSGSSSYSSGYDSRPKTVSVSGYYRKNGTYVAPYMRRAPRRR